MNVMMPFDFNGNAVRVVRDEQGEPWFVAKDIAELLGYGNLRDAILRHCKGSRETRLPSRIYAWMAKDDIAA